MATFDLDGPWSLHPKVELRTESFGALAYHFGNRKLSFLKSRKLLAVVESLAGSTSAREACLTAGVAEEELATYEKALDALSRSDMIVAGAR